MSTQSSFPDGFLWGAATSAYQIEGSPLADGAGANIWHRFSHTPGRTFQGQHADIACDHYRRWESDVELVRELGLNSYRFSLAWARLLPEGRGQVNAKGIDFYSRLIDRLLDRGITPNVTLFHWDLPAALDDRGGWLNPDSIEWFADYADVAFRAFADRVPMWATLNEPWVVIDGGYLHGVNAPGHANLFEAPLAAHHLMRAHADAVRRYRAGKWPHRIGLVVNLEPKMSASEDPADVAATARAHTYFNEQYLDPVFFGRTPAGLADIYGAGWPALDPAEVAKIREPLDWLGVNYYTRALTKADPARPPVCDTRVVPDGAVRMTTGWELYPQGLEDILVWVRERYGDLPLYVTENGGAYADPDTPVNGRVDDPLRVETYRQHLSACARAIARGVDLRGYFAWSLLDNFEWNSGYSKRFGLVHVDYATQQRTIKASGEYYRSVIASRGAAL